MSRTMILFTCAMPARVRCAMKNARRLADDPAIRPLLRRARCRCSGLPPGLCPRREWASTPSSSRGTITTILGCTRGSSCVKSAHAPSAKRRRQRVNGVIRRAFDQEYARSNMSSTKPISAVQSVVQELLADLHAKGGCDKIGLARESFAAILVDIASKNATASTSETEIRTFFLSLRIDELALARACAAGNESAWKIFLTRYREKLYLSALRIAREDSAAL